MANMEGYEEALLLAKKHHFFDKVGLHLNFSLGKPLLSIDTMPSYNLKERQMCITQFARKQLKNIFFLPKRTKLAIQNEARKQIERYINSGFNEMHFDSHHHAHTVLSIYREVKKETKEFDFKTTRLSLNLTVLKKSILKKIYKKYFNSMIKKSFKTTTYFTSAEEFVEIGKKNYDPTTKTVKWGKLEDSIIEIMVHPAYDENHKLVNLYDGTSFEELMKYINLDQLISYKDLTE